MWIFIFILRGFHFLAYNLTWIFDESPKLIFLKIGYVSMLYAYRHLWQQLSFVFLKEQILLKYNKI